MDYADSTKTEVRLKKLRTDLEEWLAGSGTDTFKICCPNMDAQTETAVEDMLEWHTHTLRTVDAGHGILAVFSVPPYERNERYPVMAWSAERRSLCVPVDWFGADGHACTNPLICIAQSGERYDSVHTVMTMAQRQYNAMQQNGAIFDLVRDGRAVFAESYEDTERVQYMTMSELTTAYTRTKIIDYQSVSLVFGRYMTEQKRAVMYAKSVRDTQEAIRYLLNETIRQRGKTTCRMLGYAKRAAEQKDSVFMYRCSYGQV